MRTMYAGFFYKHSLIEDCTVLIYTVIEPIASTFSIIFIYVIEYEFPCFSFYHVCLDISVRYFLVVACLPNFTVPSGFNMEARACSLML